MKRKFVLFALVLTLVLATFTFAYAEGKEDVARVHIILPGEKIESKRKTFGLNYTLDTGLSDYSADPNQHDGKNVFLIMPTPAAVNAAYEVHTLEMDEQGQLCLTDVQESFKISRAGTGIILRHLVSEGIPNLAVCILGENRLRDCWVPRYNNMDGSLVLDEGFYQIRGGGGEDKKVYSRSTEPLLSGAQLIDQPQVMVGALESAEQLNALAKERGFTPIGAFNPAKPRNFIFVPLVLPTTMRLHVVEYQGGDGFMNPVPLTEIALDDYGAAVFSFDPADLHDSNNPEEEREYAFTAVDGTTGKVYYWYPSMEQLGVPGKFVALF